MGRPNVAGILAAVSVVIALSGCTVPVAPASPSPTGTPEPSSESIDESACAEYSDALTLIYNMDSAQRDGRLIGNEWSGIQQLTMRLIDRIEIDPATDVGVAISDLQGQIEDSVHPLDPYADEWVGFMAAVSTACTASNPDFGVGGWVGG